MDRRSSIKTLLILSAGAVLLPSCLRSGKSISVPLKNLTIDAEQEDLVAAIADTIIPSAPKSPGAADVGAYQFALMMIDDCYSPNDHKQFVQGLNEFDDFSNKILKTSFTDATAKQRIDLLKIIETNKDVPANVSFVYNNIRWQTLRAFTQSKYYLTEVQKYVLVPGAFYGCVPVKKQTE
ncbi:MAG TPA: gluconate 2-dehydrogenase subunit 3 family protein [Pelobium sp.]